MIVGIGLDVVETGRWGRALERIQDQIFTPDELASCADRADRIEALAARFAAKEACIKALNAGIREGALRQVEIVSRPGERPRIRLTGGLLARARESKVRTAHISLTHQQNFAAAMVILEAPRTRASSSRPRDRLDTAWTLETITSGTW